MYVRIIRAQDFSRKKPKYILFDADVTSLRQALCKLLYYCKTTVGVYIKLFHSFFKTTISLNAVRTDHLSIQLYLTRQDRKRSLDRGPMSTFVE